MANWQGQLFLSKSDKSWYPLCSVHGYICTISWQTVAVWKFSHTGRWDSPNMNSATECWISVCPQTSLLLIHPTWYNWGCDFSFLFPSACNNMPLTYTTLTHSTHYSDWRGFQETHPNTISCNGLSKKKKKKKQGYIYSHRSQATVSAPFMCCFFPSILTH